MKFFEKLLDLPTDKLKHMIAGVLLFIAGNFFGMDMAIAVVVLGACLREIENWWTGDGTPEWMDILFTLIGGAMGWAIVLQTSGWHFISA